MLFKSAIIEVLVQSAVAVSLPPLRAGPCRACVVTVNSHVDQSSDELSEFTYTWSLSRLPTVQHCGSRMPSCGVRIKRELCFITS
jgi:hypothetical protein